MSDPGWSTRTRFVSALARAVAADGFVRDGNALVRARPETFQVLFVQPHADHPLKVSLDVGVASRAVDALEASQAGRTSRPAWWDRFIVGKHLAAELAPKPEEPWWTLVIDADMTPLVGAVRSILLRDVFPWFDGLATDAALATHLESRLGELRGERLARLKACLDTLYKATGRAPS